MVGGQYLDVAASAPPGPDGLRRLHELKTGRLIAASIECVLLLAGPHRRATIPVFRTFASELGVLFQIVDDILDFTGDEAEMGKPAGSDLMQGTLTLPSLILMERYPNDNPIQQAFRTKKPKTEHVAKAVHMVLDSDILNETYDVARDFRDRALTSLRTLPDTPARASLEDIAEYVLDRRA